ncbi:MAG: iron ABC transporter permease [Treponema sp.]|jgi:iron(III) transport system permease protein|nr:iron ABC transporter permease [Treponema sp.]
MLCAKRNKLPGFPFRISLLPALSVVMVILVLCPLGMVFTRALVYQGRPDISHALGILGREENLRTITNTLILGLSVVFGSTLMALPPAFLIARTPIGRHKWLDIVFLVPFMTPPYIASMGWILFMQKRGLFQQLFPFTGTFSENFFSFGGMVLVMSFHVFPFLYTILKNAILNMGTGPEESAAIFGGGWLYRLRRVTLPLLSGNYAIGALLVFVKTLSEYGTPATLGRRIGFSVFTTDIHRYATVSPIDFGKSASLSGVLIGLCLLAWVLQNQITTRRSYRLIGGKGLCGGVKPLDGFRRIAAWGFVVLILFMSIGIPCFSVLCTSLIKLRGYGIRPGNFTLGHYAALFAGSRARTAFMTSIILALSSASIAALLGTALAAAIHYSPRKGRKVVEALSLAPEMLPGIVFVIGIMLFWNTLYRYIPLYNTIGIMILGYVTLFLPYTIQYVNSSFSQIGENLIQAGRTLGGSPAYVFRRVTLPLLFRGVAAGWVMTFIISFRELVSASLIAPPNTLVVSTFIIREFEQGSVSVGMAMAVICVVFTTAALITFNGIISGRLKQPL